MTGSPLTKGSGSPPHAPRWVLLIHQIPPKPDYFRVKVWRRLQRLGAVAIKDSVYVLPRTEETVEDFQWQMREIVAEGGEASVCEASFVDGLRDTEIENLFRAAREADYREIAASAGRLRKAPPARDGRAKTDGQIDSELARLKRRLAEVITIDFYGAPSRRAAQDSIARIDAGKRTRHVHAATASREAVDTHEGEACTFETLIKRFGLADPALRAIGEIVHDIDYKEPTFGRPETAGVERLLSGIARQHAEDTGRITLGAALFDALHEAFAEPPKATADLPIPEPRSSKKPRRKKRR